MTDQNAVRAASHLRPMGATETAFALDAAEHQLEELTKTISGLKYSLSRLADSGTVARGDEFDLLIEVVGTCAGVKRCRKARD